MNQRYRKPGYRSRIRDEYLNGTIFYSLKEATLVIEQWHKHYNTIRPYSSLNYRPSASQTSIPATPVWIENLIRVDDETESPQLSE